MSERFPLVDGKCPVCDTQVEHVGNNVRMRFIPHDDPDWCRAAAMYNNRMLKRALEQASEDRALVQQRESFYQHAYALALRSLEDISPRTDWRASIEETVAQGMVDAALLAKEYKPPGGG